MDDINENNAVFLDDKLYHHAKNKEVNTHFDMQELVSELYAICGAQWKPQMKPQMPKKDVKAILDRTFNSWDLFIKRLEKENYIFVDILKKYSYKRTFMEQEDLKRIYKKL